MAMSLRAGSCSMPPQSSRRSASTVGSDTVVIAQDADTFARQAATVQAADSGTALGEPKCPRCRSSGDPHPIVALEPVGTFEYVEPIGAGRIRGLILHKLMEELLTGELSAQDDVAARAERLRDELLAIEPTDELSVPVTSRRPRSRRFGCRMCSVSFPSLSRSSLSGLSWTLAIFSPAVSMRSQSKTVKSSRF